MIRPIDKDFYVLIDTCRHFEINCLKYTDLQIELAALEITNYIVDERNKQTKFFQNAIRNIIRDYDQRLAYELNELKQSHADRVGQQACDLERLSRELAKEKLIYRGIIYG